MSGGTFFRRNPIKKSDGELLMPLDLEVGKSFTTLGREIHVTDADQYTRDYFRYNTYLY